MYGTVQANCGGMHHTKGAARGRQTHSGGTGEQGVDARAVFRVRHQDFHRSDELASRYMHSYSGCRLQNARNSGNVVVVDRLLQTVDVLVQNYGGETSRITRPRAFQISSNHHTETPPRAPVAGRAGAHTGSCPGGDGNFTARFHAPSSGVSGRDGSGFAGFTTFSSAFASAAFCLASLGLSAMVYETAKNSACGFRMDSCGFQSFRHPSPTTTSLPLHRQSLTSTSLNLYSMHVSVTANNEL